jgi:phosphomannomutase
VGEANVVAGIRDARARGGGEGPGGFLRPELHLGRAAPAAAAVLLSGLAERRHSLGAWARELPALHLVKRRAAWEGEIDWERTAGRLRDLVPGGALDLRDGVRVAGRAEWVHLRASGTEPIIRVIAEAESPGRADALANAALAALE